MKTLERWLSMSTPVLLRKVMMFAEFTEKEGEAVIAQYRACAMVGRQNETVTMGIGSTPTEALEDLDKRLANEAAKLMFRDDDEG